jgi:hypothetical protein
MKINNDVLINDITSTNNQFSSSIIPDTKSSELTFTLVEELLFQSRLIPSEKKSHRTHIDTLIQLHPILSFLNEEEITRLTCVNKNAQKNLNSYAGPIQKEQTKKQLMKIGYPEEIFNIIKPEILFKTKEILLTNAQSSDNNVDLKPCDIPNQKVLTRFKHPDGRVGIAVLYSIEHCGTHVITAYQSSSMNTNTATKNNMRKSILSLMKVENRWTVGNKPSLPFTENEILFGGDPRMHDDQNNPLYDDNYRIFIKTLTDDNSNGDFKPFLFQMQCKAIERGGMNLDRNTTLGRQPKYGSDWIISGGEHDQKAFDQYKESKMNL